MARKSGQNMGRKKTAPSSKNVRIAEDVYDDAMIVAAFERVDLTKYLSDTLRPIVTAAKLKHSQRMLKEQGTAPE